MDPEIRTQRVMSFFWANATCLFFPSLAVLYIWKLYRIEGTNDHLALIEHSDRLHSVHMCLDPNSWDPAVLLSFLSAIRPEQFTLELLDEPIDLEWVPVFFQMRHLQTLIPKHDNMHGAAWDTT